ncbi:hypothetical protein AY599_24675 [Leptolyngbya valderiana BDU 20041]|nr:hypothetical protein AY599_24675 [Leptolyngbya valderiana BDU 20041]
MDRLEGILDSIYESALETGDWSATIMRIADFCGVENASLVAIDPRIDLALVTSPRADPDIIRQYNDTWWQHDPTAAATADASPGTVTDLATTGRELFFSSEFYGEYWSRSGLGAERIASNLYVDDGAFSSVVLQAGVRNDEIADETRARFDLLLPHLIRALRANRRLHALEMEATAVRLGGHGGFIAVDGACRIHGMDAVAERLVGQRRGVGVRRGQVVFDDVAVHRTVVHRVHRCMAGHWPAAASRRFALAVRRRTGPFRSRCCLCGAASIRPCPVWPMAAERSSCSSSATRTPKPGARSKRYARRSA